VTASADSPFLLACRRQPAAPTPVWFMRQAGRSLPEYRAIRGPGTILDAIKQPELAAEITCQPVRRYGVDAAILYSDIVVPVHAVGFGVDVAPGTGPIVSDPFRSRADLERLRPLDAATDTPYVAETIRILVEELSVPLIGFAGAPFTVASYLIEGGPSRDLAMTKALMYGDEVLWHALLDRLADLALASLRDQVVAGAQAVQLFDSWVGTLSAADYRRYVFAHSAKVFAGLADLQVPRIHFGTDTTELLTAMAQAGADVVGVDWRVSLADARARLGDDVAIQGNLDPIVVRCGWEVIERKVREVLDANAGRPGHIFNLGHGVTPETDPDMLARVVELVHGLTAA
jgi:uroporphyrinogen decarboxylase